MKLKTTSPALAIAASALTGGAVIAPAKATAESCLPVPHAICGTVQVPLVRGRPELGNTTVAYALIRHTDQSRPAAGTVTFNPGGPGQSTIALATGYAKLHSALLSDHDFLLVDTRGVNRSDAIDCGLTTPPATHSQLLADAGRCGRTLGPRSRAYTSAEIADDIDAVRAQLRIPKLILKGESYGTYLMTVYAQRHPSKVRSIVLSSAYPLTRDTWFRSNAQAMRRTIRLLCERSAGACRANRVLADLSRLSHQLRRHPLPYAPGRKLDDAALASLVYRVAANVPTQIGGIPAMAAAALHGNPQQLLDLARQTSPISGRTAP